MDKHHTAPAAIRRGRRRKNANAAAGRPRPATLPRSALPPRGADRQDADLEREVDSCMDWGRRAAHTAPARKRRRLPYGGGDAPSATAAGRVDGNADADEKPRDVPRVLPVLLHLREIGLSRRLLHKNGKRSSWESMMLHQTASSSSGALGDGAGTEGRHSTVVRLGVPVHPSSAPNSQWNALQYSSPAYYGAADNGGVSGDSHDSACIGDSNSSERTDFAHRNDRIRLHRQCWRPYARQSIPFSRLRTPTSDAILAVDRWGSYLVGIGGGKMSGRGVGATRSKGSSPHLSVNFYGVPSPAQLQQSRQHAHAGASAHTICPLIHTVPLLFKDSSSIENRNFPAPSSILGHAEYLSPAAQTPVQILLSDDGSLGVAFLHHSTATGWSNGDGSTFSQSPALRDEDILGTIVIFEPPRVARDRRFHRTKSFRCANVRVGGWGSFTMRNGLWPATLVPTKQKDGNRMDSKEDSVDSSPLCRHHLRRALSAYLLFNDEDDGFRITWITLGDGFDESEGCVPFPARPGSTRPSRNDIVFPSEGNVWEECLSDPATGYCLGDGQHQPDDHSGLDVAYEVYLRVDALLSDILSRRGTSIFQRSPYRSKSACFLPEFFYNLVRASPDDLRVLIVVVFSNKEKRMLHSTKKAPSALGVFVEVNLFDQSYDELKWVFNQSCIDKSSMKRWSNKLALNWRMRESRVGVFCLDSGRIDQQMEQWVGGTHECNVEEDLRDDFNVNLWADYVDRRKCRRTGTTVPPKDISMSSLYPYCDVITNRAVHNAIPVKRIASRKSPIELNYG